MPTDARPLSLIQAVVDLQRQARRQQTRNVAGSPIWTFDSFTITGSGDTTHTLSYLPYGVNAALLNGLDLVYGTDYSVDYTTGVVTVSATLTAGDVLHVRYVTTGDLKVAATPADTGGPAFLAASTYGDPAGASVSSAPIVIPSAAVSGSLLVLAGTIRNASGASFATPTGWTLLKQDNFSANERVAAWYKIAGSGDAGSTLNVPLTGGTDAPGLLCLAYSGIDTASPLFGPAAESYDSTAATTWPVASASADPSRTTLVVDVWGAFNAGYPVTAPTGMTKRAEGVGNSSGSNSWRVVTAADEILAAGTTQAARSVTPVSNHSYISYGIAFRGA